MASKILQEYEFKQNAMRNNLQIKKQNLYNMHPELEIIEDKINLSCIELNKAIISKNAKKIDNLNSAISSLKLQKEKLYKSFNISLDYLNPHFECNKCDDKGFIVIGNKSINCKCYQQRLIEEAFHNSNIQNLDNQKFEYFNTELFSDSVDVNKYGVNTSPRENIEKIKMAVVKFIDNFDNPNEKNLLFSGSTGLGKTFLSSSIANEILKNNKTVLYQTAPILMDQVLTFKFNSSTNINAKEQYDKIFNVDLLIIDDLGTENLNNMKFTELFNIINTRLLNPKIKTIISTNLSLQKMYTTYDERVISRIIGNYQLLRFFGDDLRIKK